MHMCIIIGVVGSMLNTQFCMADSQMLFVDDNNIEGPWLGTMEHPFRNITSGIEQASALDTIFVCNGTYFENIHLNKSVSLVGESKHSTIIDGSFTDAVVIMTANNISITDFTILNGGWNGNGVDVQHSANSVITNNIITNNHIGLRIFNSSSITVSHNQVLFNKAIEVALYSSNYSILTDNAISSKKDVYGILLSRSNYNTVNSSNALSCTYGIRMFDSNNNTVTGNNLSDNSVGIRIEAHYGPGCYNTLRDNKLANNDRNFEVVGSHPSRYIQDIDASNTVDGKPIYHWINKHNMTVPLDAGYVALINCTEIMVANPRITKNWQGVLLAYTTNSTITENNLTNNIHGISIYDSSDNKISGNQITNNPWGCGIELVASNNIIIENNISNNLNGIWLYNSSGNLFYHNNFIDNDYQIQLINSDNNTWDNGCEGNYWSDYNGTDLNCDGVGDTELPWLSVDYYPLICPYWNPADVNHDLKVDIYDVVLCCGAYGSTPSDADWNPHCDIANPYTIIDIYDIIILCNEYGEKLENS